MTNYDFDVQKTRSKLPEIEPPKYDHEFAKCVHEEQLWRQNAAKIEHELSGEVVYHVSRNINDVVKDIREASERLWDEYEVQPFTAIVSPEEYERRMRDVEDAAGRDQEVTD